jgi:hypothetical protein
VYIFIPSSVFSAVEKVLNRKIDLNTLCITSDFDTITFARQKNK